MAKSLIISRLEGCAGSGVTLLGRISGQDGEYVTQASLSSIAITVTREGGTKTADAVALTIATVIFDTLQTSDNRWTEDSTGYNFLAALPASYFTVADWYRAVVTFTPVSGEAFKAIWEGPIGSA